MLTDDDKRILAFENRWAGRKGKESAILHEFGWRQARYYQRLHAVIADPETVRVDPQLVYRVRGVTEARRAEREKALLHRDD